MGRTLAQPCSATIDQQFVNDVNQAAAKTSVLSSMICAGGVLLGVGGAAGLTDLGVIAAGASAGPWVTGALALVWLGIAAFEGYTIATTC